MTDATSEPSQDGQATAEQAALAADAVASPTAPTAEQRPEIAVGAAFAGGLVLALLLKRLAR